MMAVEREYRIGPCVHPRCRDQEGNPRLTQLTICEPCREHLSRQLAWLREDYLVLRVFLPRPTGKSLVRSARIEYGHPSEWASDTARGIAKELNRIEDDAREDLGDEPTFNIWTAREHVVMQGAYHYLSTRLDQIIDSDHDTATDLAVTVHDLHGSVRRSLGYTKQIQQLPGAHCPSCDVAALVRTVGQVTCESCGRVFVEDDYERLALILAEDALDRLIEAYDARSESHG